MRGRYIVSDLIGRGGMAEVWKGWDPQLRRHVALKILKSADPDDAARFRREAQLAARLDHPNIAAVYEAGDDWIAMRFVNGSILSRVPPRPAAALIRQAALALHHAHEQGILHRDVKPSNILVENGTAYVTDFGLAKATSVDSSISATGAVLGTPSYMSPEQARAAPVDARSDVYGLGASLYEALAGRPPFRGDSVYATLRLVAAEPPPRIPGAPEDLEAIALKCLEKAPARRYATALELADDLGRYLDRQPVLARPPSTLKLVWRRASRYRAIALLFLLAAALAAWWVVDARRRARAFRQALETAARDERAGDLARARDSLIPYRDRAEARSALERIEEKLAEAHRREEETRRRLEAERERARTILRKSEAVAAVLGRWTRLRPTLDALDAAIHDDASPIEDRRREAAIHWCRIEAFMAETPQDSASQAAMKALAGFARCLARKPDEGMTWIRQAREIDPDVPVPDLIEAIVILMGYLEDPPSPIVFEWAPGTEAQQHPSEPPQLRELLDRVRPLLESARGRAVWGREAAEELGAPLRAIERMREGDYAAADGEWTRALSLPDLRPFETLFLHARGLSRYLRGEFAGAKGDAEAVLGRRPSNAVALAFVADVSLSLAWREKDPLPSIRDSLGRYERVVALRPDWISGRLRLGAALARVAQLEILQGIDPRARLDRAVAEYAEILKRRSDHFEALSNRAMAYRQKGLAERNRGVDPRNSYGRAIEDLDAAVRLQPDFAPARINRSVALASLGDFESLRGNDARDLYRRAIEDANHALRLLPGSVGVLNNRGTVYVSLGGAEAMLGLDPRETLRLGIDDLSEVIRRDPTLAYSYINRGNAWWAVGEAEHARGLDARGSFESAARDFTSALERNPRLFEAWSNRSGVHRNLGSIAAGNRFDPEPYFEKAVSDADEALKIHPDFQAAIVNRGVARRYLGLLRSIQGQDAGDLFAGAVDDLSRAVARDPRNWYPLYERAFAYELWDRLREAAADYEAALRIAPGNPEVLERLAAVKKRLGGK